MSADAQFTPAPSTNFRSLSDLPSLSLAGITISVLVGRGDSQRTTVMRYSAQAGAPGPVQHFHRESTEWFHILAGEFTYEIEGRQVIATPGSTVFVPPRTLHRFWNSAQTESVFLFGFDRAGMEGYFEELFRFVRAQGTWPPTDLSALEQIAERYDTFNPSKLNG